MIFIQLEQIFVPLFWTSKRIYICLWNLFLGIESCNDRPSRHHNLIITVEADTEDPNPCVNIKSTSTTSKKNLRCVLFCSLSLVSVFLLKTVYFFFLCFFFHVSFISCTAR